MTQVDRHTKNTLHALLRGIRYKKGIWQVPWEKLPFHLETPFCTARGSFMAQVEKSTARKDAKLRRRLQKIARKPQGRETSIVRLSVDTARALVRVAKTWISVSGAYGGAWCRGKPWTVQNSLGARTHHSEVTSIHAEWRIGDMTSEQCCHRSDKKSIRRAVFIEFSVLQRTSTDASFSWVKLFYALPGAFFEK